MADKNSATQNAAENPQVFEASEIAKHAPQLFGYSVDIATAAFDYSGITSCTLDEARKVIKSFAERKVM